MFKISFDAATILSIPATYATAFGFIFAYGRVLVAMARSGLFPEWMKDTYGTYQTPYVTLIVGSAIGYAVCILVWAKPIVMTYLFNICMCR
jgi:amino acid transporter